MDASPYLTAELDLPLATQFPGAFLGLGLDGTIDLVMTTSKRMLW